MNLLFIAGSFPGPFAPVLETLIRDHGVSVTAVCKGGADASGGRIGSVHPIGKMGSYSTATHHYVWKVEEAVRRGAAVCEILKELRDKGYRPDVILGSVGDGYLLYTHDIFPDARLVVSCVGLNFPGHRDKAFEIPLAQPFDKKLAERIQSGPLLLELETADVILVPSEWDRETFPAPLRTKTHAAPFGLDTAALLDFFNGQETRTGMLATLGIALPNYTQVVGQVVPNVEPCWGCETVLKAFHSLQNCYPSLHLVILGGDDVTQGRWPDMGTYRQVWMEAYAQTVDFDRVHFLPKPHLMRRLRAFAISDVLVHFAYPVSQVDTLAEAMMSGRPIVGSRTGPVARRLSDEKTALLVDFFDYEELAAGISRLLEDKPLAKDLSAAARQCIKEREDRASVTLPNLVRLIKGEITEPGCGVAE